jgi:hypothetical protein
VLGDHREHVFGLEDELAGEQKVRDAAERIDVGAAIDLLA